MSSMFAHQLRQDMSGCESVHVRLEWAYVGRAKTAITLGGAPKGMARRRGPCADNVYLLYLHVDHHVTEALPFAPRPESQK